MSIKVVIQNLCHSTTEETLQETSSELAEVTGTEIIKDLNQSSASMIFSSPSEAKAAASALNGQEIDGRAIKAIYYNDMENDRFNDMGH